jgi:predicted phage tail protein
MSASRIQGAGGGGGSPTEAPNTARSIQLARIVDVLSEGPIGGLVNGLKSVFLDGVPVENADGSRNVGDFGLTMQLGGPTTEGLLSDHGFNAVEAEVSVGVQVYQAVPVVRTITDPIVDTVRVTIGVPQLTQSNDEGDLNGASFEWAIDVQSNGGGYVEKHRSVVAEKVTSTYLRAVRLDLAACGPAPWDIRVRRITPDSAEAKLQNAFYWTSYTRITTVKMAYRHSAAVGLSVDARLFQNIPSRHYDLMGYCEWEIPTNFDPIARTYTGTWNGQFKLGWTNDPAWVYYGLATNRRFGLGAYIWSQPDKWTLYELSQWCNGMVPDGRGGMEPRYTINTQLTQQAEALALLQDIAAVFRGVTVYAGGSISTAWDAPGEPVALYTPSNVVDARFVYSDGSVAAKKSSCTAWYNDISQFCKSVPITHDDDALVKKYGMRPMQITLIGCTSPSQALRQAKWALYTTEYGDQLCSFTVGAEGELGRIGQVFAVADPSESGEQLGGRVMGGSLAAAITLDRTVELLAGETYTLHVTLQDDVDPQRLRVQQRTVTNTPGVHATLQVSPPFDTAPPPDAVWVLEANTVAPTLWRYWAIKPEQGEDGATQYAVTGIKHDPSKWAAIEQNQPYKARPVRRLPDAPTKPINLALTEVVAQDGQIWRSSLVVGWEATSPGLNYLVSWRYAAGNWVELPATRSQGADIGPLNAGTVEVWVRATDVKGSPPSEALQGSIQILGNTKAAADVQALGLVNTSKGVVAAWSKSTDFDYSATELRVDGGNPETATPLATVAATSYNLGWPAVGLRTVWARHLRRGGPAGAWSYAQMTYNGPQPLLDALEGRITQEQLDAALSYTIEEAAEASLAALEGLGLEITARTAGDADLAKRTDALTAWGDNLVRNAGFSPGGGYWAEAAMVPRTYSGVPSGAPSDQVFATLSNYNYMRDQALAAYGYMAVTPGEVLDSSVWVGQAAVQPYPVAVLAWIFDASKASAGGSQFLVPSTPGAFTGWRLLQGSWTVPANVAFIVPVLYVEKPDAQIGSGQLVCFARPLIQRRAGAALAAQAAVSTEAQARATQDAALASQITTVQATVVTVQASVTSEASARVAGDTALATRADALAASNAAGALTADRNALGFAEHWYGPSVQVVAGSVPGRNAFFVGPSQGYVANKRWVAVDQAKTYRVMGRFRRGPLASRQYLVVELQDNAGNNISGDGSYWFYPSSYFDPGESWTLGQGLFGAGTARLFPPNAAAMRASAILNYDGAAGTWHQVEDLCIEAADLVREAALLTASVSNLQQAMVAGDTAVAQTVTTLTARLDNSEGGPNLLPNAGFEVHGGGLPQGWGLYNNAGAANPTTTQMVAGPDGFNACRVSWTGPNTTTKGLFLSAPFVGGFLAGQDYIVAVRVRAVSGTAYGSLVNVDYSNSGWTFTSYLRRPPLNGSWQWVVMLARASKPGELFISMESANGVVDGSFDIAQPVVHTGSIFAGFNLGKDAALSAAVQAANTAQVAGDAALAAQINTVTASVDTVSASVVQESQARATVDGELSAQWSVKVDANGYWAGLYSRSYGNTSYIDMLASVFRVASASSAPEAFFTVYTVPTQVNGITVQPGVYVRDLFFATLNGGKIVAQSIDTLQLKVGAVTAAQSGFATGNTVSIPAGSFNYQWGYNSIVGLTTTGAPVLLSGHVDVEIVLNSTTVATVLLLVSVVDQNGNALDGVSDLTLRPRVVGSTVAGKIRVPVHAYLTGYSAQLVTARLAVQAAWRNAADSAVATSGSLTVRAALSMQENKV